MNPFYRITCLAALFSAVILSAQNKTFIAVSKTGDCSILNKGEWVELKVGTQLTEQSILRNSGQPEAEIQLMGLETGDCYKVSILHDTFELRTLFEAPEAEFRHGTATKYVRYVFQTALESSSDTHIIRTFTGATQRGDSLHFKKALLNLKFTLGRGQAFSLEALKTFPSDYPVKAEVIPSGVILDNGADIPLHFILFTTQDSPDGILLNPVFGKDTVICVPARTQRFLAESVPGDATLLLIAYETPLDPENLQNALYEESGVQKVGTVTKVGVFSTF